MAGAIKSEINQRALDMGASASQVSSLTATVRTQIAELIRQEKEDARKAAEATTFAALNLRYVEAIEAQNTLIAANNDALKAVENRMIDALAALKPA